MGQILYLNPITAPVWIGGLIFYFTRPGKPYRVLGWIYASIFLLLVLVKSKIYYLAPAYPLLLAGGGLAFEQLYQRKNWLGFRPVTISALILFGAIMAPLALPILPINTMERYITVMTFGAFKNIYELTGDLRGMFGWKERVQVVASVYHGLPQDERGHAVIFASWYGIAGAIDYFGEEYDLPKSVSGHMTYHLWGLPLRPIETVVAVDMANEALQKWFDEITPAAEVELENVNPGDRRFVVVICRHPKVDLHELWPQTRHGF